MLSRSPFVVAESRREVEVRLEENAVSLTLQRLAVQVLRQHVIDVDAHGTTELQRSQLLAVQLLIMQYIQMSRELDTETPYGSNCISTTSDHLLVKDTQ